MIPAADELLLLQNNLHAAGEEEPSNTDHSPDSSEYKGNPVISPRVCHCGKVMKTNSHFNTHKRDHKDEPYFDNYFMYNNLPLVSPEQLSEVLKHLKKKGCDDEHLKSVTDAWAYEWIKTGGDVATASRAAVYSDVSAIMPRTVTTASGNSTTTTKHTTGPRPLQIPFANADKGLNHAPGLAQLRMTVIKKFNEQITALILANGVTMTVPQKIADKLGINHLQNVMSYMETEENDGQ